ncbi:hypothetical protein Hanom_Chr08g00736681 [Helianthus anomalus]
MIGNLTSKTHRAAILNLLHRSVKQSIKFRSDITRTKSDLTANQIHYIKESGTAFGGSGSLIQRLRGHTITAIV